MKRGFSFRLGLILPVCLLLLSGACAAAGFQAAAHLGNTMYIGDSITHGSRDANISWRWWMHRLLADNGIPYEEKGIVRGSHRMRFLHSEINVDVVYRGSVFHNWHAAYSGARTTDVVGTRKSGKFRNTSIAQWLGRVPCTSDELTPVKGSEINTYFVLLGTNDAITSGEAIYTDAHQINSIASKIKENLKAILAEIKAANPEARVVFIEIPTWYQWNDAEHIAAQLAGVKEINRHLCEWASEQGDSVTMVAVNDGIIDVASPIKDRGLKCMYAERDANGLHPNDQGSLLIAGNVARLLGYAGATAGQARRNSQSFESNMQSLFGENAALLVPPGSVISAKWPKSPAGEFSLAFTINGGVGNGEAGGWDVQEACCISVGNGQEAGVLQIKEAYIQWNDSVLYSLDASAGLPASLRIAYVQGDPDQGLQSGFYVWMGDQLIGEGLPSAGTTNGVSISNNAKSAVNLSELFMDSTGAYAPESNGRRNK